MSVLDSLRQSEGFRSEPYWDVNAWRIGYGSDTITRADGTVVPVQPGMSVTREDAERDLQRRVDTEFLPRARRQLGSVWDRLTPDQQDQLGDLIYNYGSIPNSVVEAAQTGDARSIGQAIIGLSGHNNGINANRRARNAAPFLGGQAGQQATAQAPNALAPVTSDSRVATNALADGRTIRPADESMLVGLERFRPAVAGAVIGGFPQVPINALIARPGAIQAPAGAPPQQTGGGGIGGLFNNIANFLSSRNQR